MDFNELNDAIPGKDSAAAQKVQDRLNDIAAKPVGSLGGLEGLLVRIAGIRGSVSISKRRVICASLRLGEGTGAVALIPQLDQAIAVYHDLMTFADIGMQGMEN